MLYHMALSLGEALTLEAPQMTLFRSMKKASTRRGIVEEMGAEEEVGDAEEEEGGEGEEGDTVETESRTIPVRSGLDSKLCRN